MTSQSTNPIKWQIYPDHLIAIYGHIDPCDKILITPICCISTPVQFWLIYFILVGLEVLLDGIQYWSHKKTVLCITVRACATLLHFPIWMRMLGQMRHADNHCVFTLNYVFNPWTRQRIHNTLIVVDYNMMVSALFLLKLPASTEISLLQQEISLWKFLLLNISLYKIFRVKIAESEVFTSCAYKNVIKIETKCV